MSKVFFVVLIALMMVSGVAAIAGTYTFAPSDADLADLPHDYFYTWGIQWTVPTDEVITGAKLTYREIYDWTYESNDHLYTHLLNSVVDPNASTTPNYVTKPGYKTITIRTWDHQGGGDNFLGQGILLGDWSDPFGSYAHRVHELFYNVPDAQLAWLADGNFGFGIDPDCHYYNCGVDFKITTDKITRIPPTIPEPMSISLAS